MPSELESCPKCGALPCDWTDNPHEPATPAGDDADLLDEIAEAISDTLDMDWQPSWAAPNILALINRERAAGEAKGRADERAAGFQSEVGDWMLECFGPEIAADRLERADRFIEEALELGQTWPAFTADRAHALVDYVFNRPVGEPSQEVGGVMVTLAALCNTAEIDIRNAQETELARIWTKVPEIRAKQASKPTGSALPSAQHERPKP